MAHIHLMRDKFRTLPWRAQVRRKGHKVMVKMFATRQEAEHWAGEQERAIRLTGLPLTIDQLKKHTLREIVERYLRDITPTKQGARDEALRLNKFLRNDLCTRSLAYVNRTDAYLYVNNRLKEVAPSTVRRELNAIQHIFEVAKDQWGFTGLVNPFRNIRIRNAHRRRKPPRVGKVELDKLLDACRSCRGLNQHLAPLAIRLAIDTGMRLQEIFNLTWNDIDLMKRRIEIRKSKTDYKNAYEGRTIILPIVAMPYLLPIFAMQIAMLKGEVNIHPKNIIGNRIFLTVTKEGFKQTWTDIRKRAGISGLTFHDLRHEAATRFDEAGLTKAEHDLMMGHANRDMTSLYIHADLSRIQAKLDAYAQETTSQAEIAIANLKVKALGRILQVAESEGISVVQAIGKLGSDYIEILGGEEKIFKDKLWRMKEKKGPVKAP